MTAGVCNQRLLRGSPPLRVTSARIRGAGAKASLHRPTSETAAALACASPGVHESRSRTGPWLVRAGSTGRVYECPLCGGTLVPLFGDSLSLRFPARFLPLPAVPGLAKSRVTARLTSSRPPFGRDTQQALPELEIAPGHGAVAQGHTSLRYRRREVLVVGKIVCAVAADEGVLPSPLS